MKNPSFIIGDRAVFAINLDDPQMVRELEVETERASMRLTKISGTKENLSIVLDDLLSRGTDGSGWDQPASATVACKRAYASAVKQLEKAGFVVEERLGMLGTVRAVIVDALTGSR